MGDFKQPQLINSICLRGFLDSLDEAIFEAGGIKNFSHVQYSKLTSLTFLEMAHILAPNGITFSFDPSKTYDHTDSFVKKLNK